MKHIDFRSGQTLSAGMASVSSLRCAPLRGLSLMLFPQESLPCTSIY